MTESRCQISACPSLQDTKLNPSKTSLNLRISSVLSSCRICLSSILNPALLTCGHKFCEDCLDQYWHVKEKPNFLVCPLCRAHVYNVDFIEKEVTQHPKKEFRKNFSLMETEDVIDNNTSTILCLKITMLIPFVYYILKWLKFPILEMMSLLRCKLWHKM